MLLSHYLKIFTRVKPCTFFAVFILSVAPSLHAKVEVVFEHNPPFQMIDEHGDGHGPVFEFAKALLLEANIQADFHGKPWARIMEKDANLPDKLILSISRTPQRLPHFIWLTSVYTGQQYVWKVKDKSDPINRPLLVAVERDSHKMKSIRDMFGRENILESLNSTQALQSLLKGRVDRFVGTTFAVAGKLGSINESISQLERLSAFDEKGLESQGLYIAFSLNTEQTTVDAVNLALQKPNIQLARQLLINTFRDAEEALLEKQANPASL